MFSAARISSQPVFSALSAVLRTRFVFARKTSPVHVQGTYVSSEAGWLPSPFRTRSSGPSRRGGAAFKPPRFEVNRLFQSFCSAAHPVDFSFEKPLGADLYKAPMKHRSRLASLSVLDPIVWAIPARRGGF